MNQAKALMALARAQRAMLRLTQTLLRHDQFDGLQAAEEAKMHSDLYLKLRDKWRTHGLVDQAEAEAADKIAGYSP